MSNAEITQLEEAQERWRSWGWPTPDVVLVAGSGLAVDAGQRLAAPRPLAELLPFPVQHLPGHDHQCELLCPALGRTVLYLRGRLHAYQGYDAHQTVFAVRLAGLLGAKALVMTNAAGGLNPDYRPGDLVLLDDHLNLTGLNPLRGHLPAAWGPQFPDMGNAYSARLRELAAEAAEQLGIPLHQGVYAGVLGPSYETPAEVRMLRTLGADVVGMSTVLEVIAARHLGLECCVVSLVTNAAAGLGEEPLDHADVLEVGKRAASQVSALLGALLAHPRLTAP